MIARALVVIVALSGVELFAQATPGAPAQAPAPAPPVKSAAEIRQHLSLKSASGLDDFGVTEVRRLSEQDDKIITLVEDEVGTKYVFTYEHDYTHQVVSYDVRRLGGEDFVRATHWPPFTSNTRSAMIEEGHKHPELQGLDQRFEIFAGGSAVLSGQMSHWNDPRSAREWRKSVRQMIGPTFTETLEELYDSGLFKSSVLMSYDFFLMRHVVYRADCQPTADLRVTAAPPHCPFDNRFV